MESPTDWPVEGVLVHTAGEAEDVFRVVDVWESEEAFKAFGETLGPALEELGVTETPETYPAHAFCPPSWRRRFAGRLAPVLLALGDLAATFGLLATFLGIGVIVNGLIVYIVVQALGERAENKRATVPEGEV